MKLGSIKQFGDRVAVETRVLVDPASAHKYPEGSYGEAVMVVDCGKPRIAAAESKVTDPSGKVLYAYKWADPEFLDLSTAQTITPGSVASSTQRIVCNEGLRTPLFDKKHLPPTNFLSLSSTPAGDGDMLYGPIREETHGQKEVTLVSRFPNDHALELAGGPAPGISGYRVAASSVRVNCNDGTATAAKSEYYDSSNRLVYLFSYNQDFPTSGNSPMALLRRIVCNTNEAGK
jgi:hypothetical protein